MEETKKVKLNIGCGKDYREGWINIDSGLMFPNEKLDIKSEIKDLDYQENTIDRILLSHVVMYFRPEELLPLLKKFQTWLRYGATLEIETIDLKKVMQITLNESDPAIVENWGLVNIFGTSETSPHRWGWMPDRLALCLYQSGFRHLDFVLGDKKPDRDFKIIATK